MNAYLKRIALLAAVIGVALSSVSASADSTAPRKVIIDQDTFGPGGTNMQSVLMLLQSHDVEVLVDVLHEALDVAVVLRI